jgi:hypothetical protein
MNALVIRSVIRLDGRAVDTVLEIAATGRNGGPALPGFLEDRASPESR